MEKTAKMADLEDDDYKRFLCVEAGNVATDVVQIPPGSKYSLLTSFQIIRDSVNQPGKNGFIP